MQRVTEPGGDRLPAAAAASWAGDYDAAPELLDIAVNGVAAEQSVPVRSARLGDRARGRRGRDAAPRPPQPCQPRGERRSRHWRRDDRAARGRRRPVGTRVPRARLPRAVGAAPGALTVEAVRLGRSPGAPWHAVALLDVAVDVAGAEVSDARGRPCGHALAPVVASGRTSTPQAPATLTSHSTRWAARCASATASAVWCRRRTRRSSCPIGPRGRRRRRRRRRDRPPGRDRPQRGAPVRVAAAAVTRGREPGAGLRRRARPRRSSGPRGARSRPPRTRRAPSRSRTTSGWRGARLRSGWRASPSGPTRTPASRAWARPAW